MPTPPSSAAPTDCPRATLPTPGWIALLLALAAAVVAAFFFDQTMIAWMREHRTAGVEIAADRISRASDWPMLAGLSVVLVLVARALRQRRVVFVILMMFSATLLAGALVTPVRVLTGRVRPNAREAKGWKGPFDDGRWAGGRHSRASFPSAHTTVIAAFVTPLILLGRRRGWRAMGGLVVLVGTSRMVLGVHHLSDVLVGAILGAASGCTVVQFTFFHTLGQRLATRLVAVPRDESVSFKPGQT